MYSFPLNFFLQMRFIFLYFYSCTHFIFLLKREKIKVDKKGVGTIQKGGRGSLRIRYGRTQAELTFFMRGYVLVSGKSLRRYKVQLKRVEYASFQLLDVTAPVFQGTSIT